MLSVDIPAVNRWIAWAHTEPAAGAVVLVCALLLTGIVGWFVPHPATVLHEAGHALVARVLGRRVVGIRVHRDSSGLTTTTGRPAGFRGLLIVLAGYPAPAGAALGLVWAWRTGWSGAGISGLILVFGVVLLLSRSWFGAALTALLLASAVGMVWAPPWAREAACLAAAGLLAAGALRGLQQAWRVWFQHEAHSGSDAQQASDITMVPQLIWLVLFTVVVVAGPVVALGSLATTS